MEITKVSLQKATALGVERALKHQEFTGGSLPYWAENLAEKAVAPYGVGTGFDVKIEQRPRSAAVEVEEFRATGPERVTNKGTAFEECIQRTERRVWQLKMECIRPDAFLAAMSFSDPYSPGHAVGPYPKGSWQLERNIRPIWILAVEVSEWISGIISADGWSPVGPTPVQFSNWALPTVGETAIV